jgi:hypothetical protein
MTFVGFCHESDSRSGLEESLVSQTCLLTPDLGVAERHFGGSPGVRAAGYLGAPARPRRRSVSGSTTARESVQPRAAWASQLDLSIEAMVGEQIAAPASTGLGEASIDLVFRFGCGGRGCRGT